MFVTRKNIEKIMTNPNTDVHAAKRACDGTPSPAIKK